LFDAMAHSESYFSGFIVVLYLVALITPLVLMIIGFILAGAGTMIYFWATEPVSINQVRDANNLVDKKNEKITGRGHEV